MNDYLQRINDATERDSVTDAVWLVIKDSFPSLADCSEFDVRISVNAYRLHRQAELDVPTKDQYRFADRIARHARRLEELLAPDIELNLQMFPDTAAANHELSNCLGFSCLRSELRRLIQIAENWILMNSKRCQKRHAESVMRRAVKLLDNLSPTNEKEQKFLPYIGSSYNISPRRRPDETTRCVLGRLAEDAASWSGKDALARSGVPTVGASHWKVVRPTHAKQRAKKAFVRDILELIDPDGTTKRQLLLNCLLEVSVELKHYFDFDFDERGTDFQLGGATAIGELISPWRKAAL